NQVANLLMEQFNDKFLPKPLHGIGRSFILTFVPPAVKKRHSLPNPNKLVEFGTKKAFKFIFKAQDNFAPDNKVSTEDRLASQKFKEEAKAIRVSEKDNKLPRLVAPNR